MALITKIEVLVLACAIAPGVSSPRPVNVDREIRLLCGSENAAYRPKPNGTIQCLTKHGHPTITVAVQ